MSSKIFKCSEEDDALSRLTTKDLTTTEVIPTISVEDLEKKRHEIIEYGLGLPTVLRRILEQFSDTELSDLSLVNKSWNFEARSVLRNRGGLKATIYTNPASPSEQRCQSFAADLKQMRVVPFTGIHFDMGYEVFSGNTGRPSAAVGSLDQSYQVILDRLPTKHLSLNFRDGWRGPQDCPLYALAIRILENYCGTLEELSISNFNNSSSAELFQTIIQSWSFPLLKTFKYDDTREALPSEFAKALVSSAPNLEKFYVKGLMNFMENVMDGSSAKLVAEYFNPFSDQVCGSLIENLRTESIHMRDETDVDVELLNRYVPMVLRASPSAVKTFELNLLLAVPLMCYGICMENVTDLWIFTSQTTVEEIQPDILALIKSFDFAGLFPKLDKVTIAGNGNNRHQHVVSAFLEGRNAVPRINLPHRADNIKQLHLKEYYENAIPPLPLLGQMFPHVQTISMEEVRRGFPFTLLWESFGCLAELNVEFSESSSGIAENLDSVFCGIFPEEVAELRAMDDEYLKAVNIVPVMPAITCLRGLRLLQINYKYFGRNHLGLRNKKDPTRLFSKVTGLIGFLRCPTLSVELIAPHTPDALDHMRPYATIVKIERQQPFIEESYRRNSVDGTEETFSPELVPLFQLEARY